MQHYRALCAVSLAALATAGCASISKEECLAGDWRSIGYQDGLQGATPALLDQHAEACARHDVVPDAAVWRAGYEEGLVSYCTRVGGFQAGVQGRTYHDVCTGEAADTFLAAYSDGRALFEIRDALDKARSSYNGTVRQIRSLRSDYDEAVATANNVETPDDQRTAAVNRANELAEEINDLNGELPQLQMTILSAEAEERDVEQRMRMEYPEWPGN